MASARGSTTGARLPSLTVVRSRSTWSLLLELRNSILVRIFDRKLPNVSGRERRVLKPKRQPNLLVRARHDKAADRPTVQEPRGQPVSEPARPKRRVCQLERQVQITIVVCRERRRRE